MAVYPCEQCGREIGYNGVCYQCKIKNEQDKFLNLSDEQIEEKIKNIVQNIEQMQNYIKEETMDEIVSHKFRLDRAPKPPFYPCFAESNISIGGHGDWVQDAEYCECPKCGKTMKLLAQIPWSLIDGGEGILYVEICPECYVLSAFHQQT